MILDAGTQSDSPPNADLLIILNISTPGDGIENKLFSEEVIFVGKLSCGISLIVRHNYDVVGSRPAYASFHEFPQFVCPVHF